MGFPRAAVLPARDGVDGDDGIRRQRRHEGDLYFCFRLSKDCAPQQTQKGHPVAEAAQSFAATEVRYGLGATFLASSVAQPTSRISTAAASERERRHQCSTIGGWCFPVTAARHCT
jgi:hypothetical protein